VAPLTEVAVPDIGDFADVPVIEVLVAVGDRVEAEDPLVVLESDKATMDVPAPFGGAVDELRVAVGDTVSEGTTLLVLDAGDAVEKAAAVAAVGAVPAVPAVLAAAPAAALPPTEPERAATVGAAAPPADGAIHASPSVRRLARELGVDLTAVSGSGRKGRIVPEDVRAFAEGGGVAAKAGGAGGPSLTGGTVVETLPWPSVDFSRYGETERVELSKIRKISAANLSRNWIRIPHVTHNDEADITELEAFRKQLNGEQSDVKVTMVALLLKAVVASLKAFPDMNSSLSDDGEALIHKKFYNLGFAADTPNGLVVPVIKDVDKKGLLAVAGELTELSGKARAGKLMPADMAGATFTISSLGGIGGTSFTPIVNAPEVAILGVVRSAMKPVWDGKEFAARLMLPLSLSYDHRVIDGAAAARFTAHLVGVLNDLRRVLL
jgi:pyruvate dehydrogenase E2 component (dihydrolipoamide acetyltransferase)